MTVADPVMLIVGGTGSIGSEIAQRAADAGWRVVVHGRSEARLAATLDGMTEAADRHAGIAADLALGDLSRGDAVGSLVAAAADRYGRLDAVIDCITGGPSGVTGRFAATDPAGYAGLLDASIGHLQRLAHAALPWLAASGGTLIAFASDAGRFAAPNQTTIGASRAAIMAFVRNLAVEVARDGVRAHCVSPSFVAESASFARTEARLPERIAKARAKAGLGLPTPADIAPLVLFLCGEGARRITGQVISVNGGLNA